MWERFWLRLLGKGLLWLTAAALGLYPVDFAVWRVRVARGGGMGSVNTYDVVAAEEKGNKEEYFPAGSDVTPCSESIYPQGGNAPCWWLSRHPDHVVRY
jgi:hypothetical protein